MHGEVVVGGKGRREGEKGGREEGERKGTTISLYLLMS